MNRNRLAVILGALTLGVLVWSPVDAQQKKPNILVIMGDDIGWFNPSIYHRGIMGLDVWEEGVHQPPGAEHLQPAGRPVRAR